VTLYVHHTPTSNNIDSQEDAAQAENTQTKSPKYKGKKFDSKQFRNDITAAAERVFGITPHNWQLELLDIVEALYGHYGDLYLGLDCVAIAGTDRIWQDTAIQAVSPGRAKARHHHCFSAHSARTWRTNKRAS
jgi:hypothetical protein